MVSSDRPPDLTLLLWHPEQYCLRTACSFAAGDCPLPVSAPALSRMAKGRHRHDRPGKEMKKFNLYLREHHRIRVLLLRQKAPAVAADLSNYPNSACGPNTQPLDAAAGHASALM
jgi:hypothetical protein